VGAVPDEIVVRSPVVVDLDDGGWVEADDAARSPGGTVIQPEPTDPFGDRTLIIPSRPRTPPMGSGPVQPRTPPLGQAPEPGRPPGRRRGAPRPARKARPSPPSAPQGIRWTWKRVLIVGLACVGALEVLAFLVAPDPAEMSARARARAQRASLVDQTARDCMGGASDACAELGRSISRELGADAKWGGEARGACARGDVDACVRLGDQYTTEARRRRQAEPRLTEPEPDAASEAFRDVACALGASACPN
jgi:hypothetical protein